MSINQKIQTLRELMKKNGIDVYYIPLGDDHLSDEYTADHFRCVSFISEFRGEASVIVTQDFAGLWTDGRYFTAAEMHLKGTVIELMRMRQPGVPDPVSFLISSTPEGGVLGFDGHVVSAAVYSALSKALAGKNASMIVDKDLVGEIWGKERPSMPAGEIFVLPKKYTGESAAERIERVREKMRQRGADVLVITALEDPCWLLNVRGNDMSTTPVAYAFAAVTQRTVTYYVDKKKLSDKAAKHLKDSNVTVKPYGAVAKDLAKLRDKTVWADLSHLNSYFSSLIDPSNRILNLASPILAMRAVKNSTEIRNTRNAHIKDGVAMVRFIRWVKENVGKIPMTEISAADKLYALRAEGKGYIEPSFHTISAYQQNAAMLHYSATTESDTKVEPRGFLLVDSGGTYLDGTTDITRTISLGGLTAEEKKYFTLVLKGMLQLTRARFLQGTTGNNLDILARGPIWDLDIDYQCGTGHGVGHVLAVHEGPHGIRWGMPSPARTSAPFEAGMIVSNEPGVYLPHELGIRTENELLVVKGQKNFYGQFLYFETLTYCPIDLDAIDVQYLEDTDIRQLNAYHQSVYETLAPLLEEDDRAWLKEATRAVER